MAKSESLVKQDAGTPGRIPDELPATNPVVRVRFHPTTPPVLTVDRQPGGRNDRGRSWAVRPTSPKAQ